MLFLVSFQQSAARRDALGTGGEGEINGRDGGDDHEWDVVPGSKDGSLVSADLQRCHVSTVS
jgi:hypothetical protein